MLTLYRASPINLIAHLSKKMTRRARLKFERLPEIAVREPEIMAVLHIERQIEAEDVA